MNKTFKVLFMPLVFAVVPVAVATATPVNANADMTQNVRQLGSAALQQQVQDLHDFVKSHGASMTPITFNVQQSISASTESGCQPMAAGATSCTATAKVSIPGGTGVTLSATAPTCGQAPGMVTKAVKNYLKKLNPA